MSVIREGFVRNLDGSHKTDDQADKAIQRICRKAGLPVRHWHTLRHAFGTHAALFGVNPWRLQAWLGHQRIDETMLYVHVAEAHHRELPEIVREKSRGIDDPDQRVLAMMGARAAVELTHVRGSGVAVSPTSTSESLHTTAHPAPAIRGAARRAHRRAARVSRVPRRLPRRARALAGRPPDRVPRRHVLARPLRRGPGRESLIRSRSPQPHSSSDHRSCGAAAWSQSKTNPEGESSAISECRDANGGSEPHESVDRELPPVRTPAAWVKSPPIDVGQFSDVRLQYRRWLSVEDSHFDAAQITANDKKAWINYTGDIGDNSATHHLRPTLAMVRWEPARDKYAGPSV